MLAGGAKKLWQEDPGCPNLQRFLKEGAKHCKVYFRRTPRFARAWIAARGNAESDVCTLTTPLEMWESALVVKDKFVGFAEETKLTIRGAGSMALYEDEQYKIAQKI